MEQLDFLAIGDITTDAFIELGDAFTEEKDGQTMLCMRFGDKIAYKDVIIVPAVGNSPNAAVSAHRLGLRAGLVTNVGDDAFGKEDIAQLQSEGIDTRYVHINEGKKSNYHYVLRLGAERTILVKHYEYEYKLPNFDLPPRFIYLSSLAESSFDFHTDIAEYVEHHPETKLVFQPGTFQMKFGKDRLARIYSATHIFFCNKEEAERILEIQSNDILELMKRMHAIGPKIVCITDGPKGAYAYDGVTAWKMPMYPDPAPPQNRTGAGDAFASTFTTAVALGLDIPTALAWGPINSAYVVQKVGAQKGLLSRAQLEEHLAHAPAEYKAQAI